MAKRVIDETNAASWFDELSDWLIGDIALIVSGARYPPPNYDDDNNDAAPSYGYSVTRKAVRDLLNLSATCKRLRAVVMWSDAVRRGCWSLIEPAAFVAERVHRTHLKRSGRSKTPPLTCEDIHPVDTPTVHRNNYRRAQQIINSLLNGKHRFGKCVERIESGIPWQLALRMARESPQLRQLAITLHGKRNHGSADVFNRAFYHSGYLNGWDITYWGGNTPRRQKPAENALTALTSLPELAHLELTFMIHRAPGEPWAPSQFYRPPPFVCPPSLRRLRLRGSGDISAFFSIPGAFRSLERLDILSAVLSTASSAAGVLPAGAFPSVRRLLLEFAISELEHALQDAMSRAMIGSLSAAFPALTSLAICLESPATAALVEVGPLGKLERLSYWCSIFDDDDGEDLPHPEGASRVIAALLSKNPHLVHLTLKTFPVTPEDIVALCELRELRDLHIRLATPMDGTTSDRYPTGSRVLGFVEALFLLAAVPGAAPLRRVKIDAPEQLSWRPITCPSTVPEWFSSETRELDWGPMRGISDGSGCERFVKSPRCGELEFLELGGNRIDMRRATP